MLDFVKVIVAKPEIRGTNEAIDLCGPACADDRARDRGTSERPGDGDLARRTSATCANGAELLDQFQVSREPRLLELGASPPPIVLWERGDTPACHGPAQ